MPLHITILYGLCLLLVLGFSFLIFYENPKSRAHQCFFLFGITISLWIIFLYSGFYFAASNLPLSAVSAKASYFVSLWFPLFLTWFFYYFPRPTPGISRLLLGVMSFPTFLLSYLILFTPLIHESQVITEGVWAEDNFGRLYWLYSFYTVAHLILTFLFALGKIRLTQGIERKKLLIAFGGVAIFYLLGMLTNVILPQFNIFIFQMESVLFSLFFILPTAYSIQKYRFFNFSNTSLNFLRGVILIGAVFALMFFPYKILGFLFPTIPPLFVQMVSFFIGAACFFPFSKIFPELLSSGFRDFRDAIIELRIRLYSCMNYLELQKLLDQIFVIRLNIPQARLYIVRDFREPLYFPVYLKDDFTIFLEANPEILVLEELRLHKQKKTSSHSNALVVLGKLEAELCMPLLAEKKLIGFLTLSQKQRESFYAREEIQEISKLRNPLEITLMNILLQGNLQEERDFLRKIVREKTQNLQDLVQQQADFIAVSAHELRTPLTIAMFKLQEILEGSQELRTTPELLRQIHAVETALQNLSHLTQQLFEIQQYELGKIHLHPTKVAILPFLRKIHEEFARVMAGANLDFSFSNLLRTNVALFIDEEKMRQLLGNLLSNALKFTPPFGKVTLCVLQAKGQVIIQVDDTGSGIADSEKSRIFEKFQTTNTSLGIGLGLYLCRNIAELHSGKIWVEDAPGGGARFSVALKIKTSKSLPNRRKSSKDRSSKKYAASFQIDSEASDSK